MSTKEREENWFPKSKGQWIAYWVIVLIWASAAYFNVKSDPEISDWAFSGVLIILVGAFATQMFIMKTSREWHWLIYMLIPLSLLLEIVNFI